MGLDFSYLLYFHRKDLWKVLKGLTDYTSPSQKSTQITFPDHTLTLPLESWCAKEDRFNFDDPVLGFVLSMRFPVDVAIFGYLSRQGQASVLIDPSLATKLQYEYIGYIYLTIHQNLTDTNPDLPPSDLVLLDFGTPGSTMSILFCESDEIRNTFTDILDNYDGACGVFNREEAGEVIWYEGRQVSLHLENPFLSVGEIEALLR